VHASVASHWRAFNEPFEGVVSFMYQDVKGLITIGMGNFIDPVDLALDLPFSKRNKKGIANPGSFATRAEIATEWNLIKNDKSLAKKGHRACDPLCTLELNDVAIDQLITAKLASNEAFLKRQQPWFKDFDSWPADAQMGLLSMAWAMGPGFGSSWPRFRAACQSINFADNADSAAENCKMQEGGNPGVIPRNRANKRLFQNADAVLAGESDGFYIRPALYYPVVLLKPITITA
jgi:GH24 family phage-related lysozyme (muramidase)